MFRRLRNAARRVVTGLRLHAENVSPDCPNDLFRAHESIYVFAARFVVPGEHRRVLDLGCGTGYGTALLSRAAPAEAVGIDLDPRNVRFARRRFPAPRFVIGDAQGLPEELGRFDLVVASNVLEHLAEVDRALDGLAKHLVPGGTLVAVVPPITDAASLAENERNPFHRSNLRVEEWLRRLESRFGEVSTFRHLPPAGGPELDFTDPYPSVHAAEDFRFLEVSPERLGTEPTLGAVFVCRRPSSLPS